MQKNAQKCCDSARLCTIMHSLHRAKPLFCYFGRNFRFFGANFDFLHLAMVFCTLQWKPTSSAPTGAAYRKWSTCPPRIVRVVVAPSATPRIVRVPSAPPIRQPMRQTRSMQDPGSCPAPIRLDRAWTPSRRPPGWPWTDPGPSERAAQALWRSLRHRWPSDCSGGICQPSARPLGLFGWYLPPRADRRLVHVGLFGWYLPLGLFGWYLPRPDG